MKTWQIFGIGVVALVVTLFLPVYEPAIAAIGALVIVAVVLIGFLAHPRRDVFYIQTTVRKLDHDRRLIVDHDCVAVRVELARLWLLFVPTFAAVAFLLVTSAQGTTWKFSLLDITVDISDANFPFYLVFLMSRVFLFALIGLLSEWMGERWILRDATACSARWISPIGGAQVSYSFLDNSGEFYGGECILFRAYPAEIATIVLYHVRKPELSRLAVGFMFHRLVVIGRGITDLDEATVRAHAKRAQVPI